MSLYEYTPPKSNKKALGVIIILLSLAIGLFAFTMIFPNIALRWLVQLIAVLALVAVIFIISRYIAKSFLYTIAQNDDGTLDLNIAEITNAGRKK